MWYFVSVAIVCCTIIICVTSYYDHEKGKEKKDD